MTRLLMKLMPFFLVVFAISLAFAQRLESEQRKHTLSTYEALAEAPQKARSRTNPFEGNPRQATAGGKLFAQHCSQCHGPKAGGTTHGPSLMSAEVQQATPGTIFWVLTNGVVRRGMPVWSKLPEQERWQIVTFLRSINSRSTPQEP